MYRKPVYSTSVQKTSLQCKCTENQLKAQVYREECTGTDITHQSVLYNNRISHWQNILCEKECTGTDTCKRIISTLSMTDTHSITHSLRKSDIVDYRAALFAANNMRKDYPLSWWCIHSWTRNWRPSRSPCRRHTGSARAWSQCCSLHKSGLGKLMLNVIQAGY